MNQVHYSSDRHDWGTPWDFYLMLSMMYGPFTLDPCATANNAKCDKFYTIEDDGLAQDWAAECVFMNPPYGREIGKWVKKAYEEAWLGGARVVALLPARTDTRWWHDYVMRANTIRFVRGRLRFEGAENSAPFPSAVVIWHPGTADRGWVMVESIPAHFRRST